MNFSVNTLLGNSQPQQAKKRIRTTFTEYQLEYLEELFAQRQYVTGVERAEIASRLHLTTTQVKVWYQNRRIRWRRTQAEMRNRAQVKAVKDQHRQ